MYLNIETLNGQTRIGMGQNPMAGGYPTVKWGIAMIREVEAESLDAIYIREGVPMTMVPPVSKFYGVPEEVVQISSNKWRITSGTATEQPWGDAIVVSEFKRLEVIDADYPFSVIVDGEMVAEQVTNLPYSYPPGISAMGCLPALIMLPIMLGIGLIIRIMTEIFKKSG